MAWTNTAYPTVFGNKKVIYGAYDSTGATSGSVATGLTHIDFFLFQSTYGVTFPYASVSGGTLTVTSASGDTGYYMVVGE